MAFYENTLIAKQDLAEKELKEIKDKYNKVINDSSGKVVKVEEWGLLNLANKIKNYKKDSISITNLKVIKILSVNLKKSKSGQFNY